MQGQANPAQADVFERLPIPAALRKMIFPAVVSQLIVLIYNMADTFFVGLTNNPYMVASTSLILPVFNITLCLAGLAGIGGGSLISRLLGTGEETEARKVSMFSFWLGAGLATLLSNCIACLYFLLTLWHIRDRRLLTADPRVGLPRAKNIRSVFSVGIPSATTNFLFDLDYMVVDKLMVSYNEVALAAIGIVLKVERLPLNTGIGICQGMVPLIAYNCGAGNHKRMNQVIRLSLATGLVVAAVSILLYQLFAPWIIGVFIADGPTISLAVTFIRIRIWPPR